MEIEIRKEVFTEVSSVDYCRAEISLEVSKDDEDYDITFYILYKEEDNYKELTGYKYENIVINGSESAEENLIDRIADDIEKNLSTITKEEVNYVLSQIREKIIKTKEDEEIDE